MKRKAIIKKIVLVLIAFLTLSPLLYMIIVSFEPKNVFYKKIISFSIEDWSWINYISVINNFGIKVKFANSSLVTLGSVFVSLTLSLPLAYKLTNTTKKVRQFVIILLLVFAIIPEHVTILSSYKYFLNLNLDDSLFTVILILAQQNLPFATLMLYAKISTIPQSLHWAMEVDGCSEFKKFIYLIIPVSRNSIFVQIIWMTISSWNSILVPMVFLHSEELKTLMPAIASLDRRYGSNIPFQMASIVIASIPIILLYMVFHKKIIEQMDVEE